MATAQTAEPYQDVWMCGSFVPERRAYAEIVAICPISSYSSDECWREK
jgi:hypothetical protein